MTKFQDLLLNMNEILDNVAEELILVSKAPKIVKYA